MACYHVKQDDTKREHIRFARLVVHFQMNFWTHVIDSPNKRFAVFVEIGSKHEIRNFHIEVFFIIYEQILGLKITVRKPKIVDVLQSVNQLFEVVPGYRFLQPTGLRQHHEQIRLVSWEHEV